MGLKGRLHPANELPQKLFFLSSYNGIGSCFSTELLSENQMHVPEVNKDKQTPCSKDKKHKPHSNDVRT